MDRITVRIDQQQQDCIFLIDSIKNDTITMWRPEEEPETVPLAFYHNTLPIKDNKRLEAACVKYSSTWGVQAQLMRRLPRNYEKVKASSLHKNSMISITSQKIGAVTSEERAYYSAVKSSNGQWEIISSSGEVKAITNSLNGARAALEHLTAH